MKKLESVGTVLLLAGAILAFLCALILVGGYEYGVNLMVSSGLVVYTIGLVAIFVGLLFKNNKDDRNFKAAAWVYLAGGATIYILSIVRLVSVFQVSDEVGLARLFSTQYLPQILVIVTAFVLELVALYLTIKGFYSTAGKDTAELRGVWRQLRISGVTFLVMKLLSLSSYALWEEGMLKSHEIVGEDVVIVPEVTGLPFDVDFFVTIETIASVLVYVAGVWMLVSFFRILVPLIKTAREG